MNEGMWVRFEVAGQKPKTMVWNVIAKADNVVLGQVLWFARWRGYAFFPAPDTLYEARCLSDIAAFIKEQNAAQRRKP
jgi:hypothetical protein